MLLQPTSLALVLFLPPVIFIVTVLSTASHFFYFIIVVFNAGDWPAQDVLAPSSEPYLFTTCISYTKPQWSFSDSSQVQEWMQELAGWTIPDLDPTVDGTCANDPVNAANAAARGWWTCGAHTRGTDITDCPDEPMTWGLRYVDTQELHEYPVKLSLYQLR